MKTKVTIILFIFLFFNGCSSNLEKEKNDLKEMKLNGNVKSLRSYSYNVVEKFGEISKGKRQRGDKYILFNDKGNKIEKNIYKSDGSLDYKETYKYEYDEKYNWIKKIEYKNGIPEFIFEREIEYYN